MILVLCQERRSCRRFWKRVHMVHVDTVDTEDLLRLIRAME